MAGFTKLFNTILTSTVWGEDAETKVIWITLLALLDKDGTVDATIPGISRISGVSIEKVEQAMNKFLSPDQYSRSSEFEGRRIEKIDGGYIVLNAAKYRAKMRGEERTEYIRNYMRERREKEKKDKSVNKNVNFVNSVNPSKPIAEAEAEAKAVNNYIVQKFAQFWDIYPKKKNKQGAFKAFKKISPDDNLLQIILNAIEKQCKTDQWKKDNGQFIPLPSTFLNNKRWEDEIEKQSDKNPAQLEFERLLKEESYGKKD